jgi:malate dehydrogenase
MATACIIGAGEIGGAVAHALARTHTAARIVLIDDAATIAAGKALDIQQSGAIEGFHVRLSGSDDLSRAGGAAVCVIADRAGRPATEWQGEDGLARLGRSAPHLGNAPIVFAGTQQTDLLLAVAREMRVARPRLIGSAPEAYASAVTALVAMEAGCSPADVKLAVLGVPPKAFVVPWGEASIGGYALERVLTQVQITRLEARAARLWPPGPHALGAAAARVAAAVMTSARRAYSVLAVLGGEFGVRGRVGALPAHLSTDGIIHTRVPTLNTRERVRVEVALGT